jgi:hypothetical protein
MKIGAIIAVNRDEDNIWFCLKGIYDFCDKVVVVYSDTDWVGCKREDKTLSIIEAFEDPHHKIRLIKGTYTDQPGQRTVGLDWLKQNGFDYCFVVDSDEIYEPVQLQWVRKFLEQGKDALNDIVSFNIRWVRLWKKLCYCLIPNDAEVTAIYKLTDQFAFTERRGTNCDGQYHMMLPECKVVCYHLTCVCTDRQMKEKIQTRSYRDKVVLDWYKQKWLKWRLNVRDLHPTHPEKYHRAVMFDQTRLPEFMKTHKFYTPKGK